MAAVFFDAGFFLVGFALAIIYPLFLKCLQFLETYLDDGAGSQPKLYVLTPGHVQEKVSPSSFLEI